MKLINSWDAEAELMIHSSWVKMFREKFVGTDKEDNQTNNEI